MPKTLHLVWNLAKNECVGFLDKDDADWTSKGGRHRSSPYYPAIGEQFRETYGDEAKKLPQSVVEIAR